MGQVSAKLRRSTSGFLHWCPACGELHALPDSWTFNGNVDRPAFTPSFKHTGKRSVVDEKGDWTGEWHRDERGEPLDWCCHYILTDGILNFCADCTHGMSGQSVPLPDLPHHLRDEGSQWR